MHNPHTEVLQVREIFTTEDFLSLKSIMSEKSKGREGSEGSGGSGAESGMGRLTPSRSGADASLGLWEIQPGEEREIVVLTMVSSIPGNPSPFLLLPLSILVISPLPSLLCARQSLRVRAHQD